MATVAVTDHALQTSRTLITELLTPFNIGGVAIRFWDGSLWQLDLPNPAKVTIALKTPGALRHMFLPPSDLKMGEAYIYNDFDIEGDISAIFPLINAITGQGWGRMEQIRFGARLLSLPRTHEHVTAETQHLRGRQHSRDRDKQAIKYHYDRSNAFYQLFLDQRMVYSCAYFPDGDTTLDQAQVQKLDYLCRKLRLQPGEQLLDIGCGWGGLLIYAAQHYGVYGRGITLSEEQAKLARERIDAAGLADRCSVEVRDYREVQPPQGGFDKLVSVGMFEHVGGEMLDTYFRRAYSLLKPGGVFLNHGIAQDARQPFVKKNTFVTTYVFPDGELLPLNTTLHAAEMSGFEVRDVESLREHYSMTLRHWINNLEAHADEARQETDETTYRVWRLYMAGAQNAFDTGLNNLYQTLMVKPLAPGKNTLPLSRADWYTRSESGEGAPNVAL